MSSGLEAGWRATPSGLMVPEALPRAREVWPWADVRDLNKVIKTLGARGITLLLRCEHAGCAGTPMERIVNPDGGFTLRCAHLDRVFTRAI
jgi:hypothetical protein